MKLFRKLVYSKTREEYEHAETTFFEDELTNVEKELVGGHWVRSGNTFASMTKTMKKALILKNQ